jgi:hypothetical protein
MTSGNSHRAPLRRLGNSSRGRTVVAFRIAASIASSAAAASSTDANPSAADVDASRVRCPYKSAVIPTCECRSIFDATANGTPK